MKKINVNVDKCIGCGACEGFEPEVFELSDDGFATVKQDDFDKLSDDAKENVEAAVSSCPTEAISIEEK